MYVLIRLFMYAKLLLAIRVYEERLDWGTDVGKELREGKALREDGVASPDDGVAQDAGVGLDEGAEAPVHSSKVGNFAGAEKLQAFDEELGGELGQGWDGVAPLVALCLFSLQALGALRAERQGGCGIFERLFIVARGWLHVHATVWKRVQVQWVGTVKESQG